MLNIIDSPAFTALIRAKNSAGTLMETVARLKAQIYPPAEILVVDSGSTDSTIDIATNAGCRVLHYPEDVSFHYSKALNIGFAAIDTPLVLVVSSHVWLPSSDTTHWMVRLLTNFPAAGVHCPLGGSGEMLESMLPRFECVDSSNFNGMNGLSNCCALYRRADWEQRPFDETIPTAEDQLWASVAIAEGGITICLTSHLVAYRNPTGDLKKSVREMVVIHEHVLPRTTLWIRFIKLLLNVPKWILKGNMSAAFVNAAVAKSLLVNLLSGRSNRPTTRPNELDSSTRQ